MSIELKALKIDPEGKGVTPLPDTPALSAKEMQAKFDELPLACIKQINNVIDDLLCLKEAITNAVGVVIPKTNALLRGDGEGNVDEQPIDDKPMQDSQNPITSGAVYDEIKKLSGKEPSGGVVLWEGSWSTAKGATLTISKSDGSIGCTGLGNIVDYEWITACCGGTSPYLLHNDGSNVVGGGTTFSKIEYEANSKNGTTGRSFRAAISGNTLTVEYHRSTVASETADKISTASITQFCGIKFDKE